MACCGQRRNQVTQPATSSRPSISVASSAVPAARPSVARTGVTAFQYTGLTALTAVGALSGRRYQFSQPGAVVAVDPRDRASLAALPQLRQV